MNVQARLAAAPARALPGAPPLRFLQLTYSSFDRGDGGRGGWQVKDRTVGLTPQEQDLLVAGVATVLDDQRVPPMPTAEELGARRSRLVYAPIPAGGSAYWHTTAAGPDGSGRPGNVFAHVLLDRNPTAVDLALRPSDLALSPHWLRPYGAQAVLASSLDVVPPPPWPDPVLDRSAVVQFLVQEAVWRPGVLAALLDAVRAALAAPPGPPVALVVADPARGMRWIAAVCHLMSPGTSRGLFWSSHERVTGLRGLREKGIHLALLPDSELDGVDAEAVADVVLIVDDEDAVELGDLPHDEPHQTRRPRRREIAVTPYSVVAALVLQEATLAERVLERQDELAAEAGDNGLPCGWPLAVAALELADELGDVADEARQLLREGGPPGLPAAMRRRIHGGSQVHTPQAALAQAVAAAAGRGPIPYEEAVNLYFQWAIDNPEWLLEELTEQRPLLPPEALDTDLVDRACGVLDGFVEEADAEPAARMAPAVYAVRLIEFALGIGLTDALEGASRSLPDTVQRTLDDLVGPLLLDPVLGPVLVRRTGAVPEPVQAAYVRPWVDRFLDGHATPPPGRRIPSDVLVWLFPEPPTPPDASALAERGAMIAPTLVELALQVTSIVPDPSAFVPLAAWARLGAASDLPASLARLATARTFTSTELCALVVAFDPLPVVPLMLPALLCLPDDKALHLTVQRLLDGSLDAHAGEPVVADVLAAARLRSLAGRWVADQRSGLGTTGHSLLESAASVLARVGRPRLARDVADVLLAARVTEVVDSSVQTVERPGLTGWLEEAAPDGVVSDRAVAILVRRAGPELLCDFAVAAQLSSAAPGAVQAGPSEWGTLAWLRVRPTAPPEGLFDHVVRRILRERRTDVAELAYRVRGIVAHHLHRSEPDGAHDTFAERWWRSVGAGDPVRTVFPQRGYFG